MSLQLNWLVAATVVAVLGFWNCALADSVGEEESQASATVKLDVAYVPTPQHVVDLMLHLAQVQKTDVLYDLGCGDGRIVVSAAQRYGCRALGVDIDPVRVEESRRKVIEAELEDLVTIRQQDLLELDLSEADVITMFLTPKLNLSLLPQLEKLKPGSRIVSHKWDMFGVDPDMVVTVAHDEQSNDIYLWTVPFQRIASPEDLPVIDEHRPTESDLFDAAWTFAFQHNYQRFLLIVVVAALGVAAGLGMAQSRIRVTDNK